MDKSTSLTLPEWIKKKKRRDRENPQSLNDQFFSEVWVQDDTIQGLKELSLRFTGV